MTGTGVESMRAIVTYARCSTARQGVSKLGLDAQELAMRAFAEAHGYKIVDSFVEVESGKGNEDTLERRPKLREALSRAKLCSCRVLVKSLDRLSRDVAFISGLMSQGVPFYVGDLGPDVEPFMLHIIASFAQREREQISLRTKAALQAAKKRCVRLGGNRGHGIVPEAAIRSIEVRKAKSDEHKAGVLPVLKDLQKDGVTTLQGLADALNAKGIPASRGGDWNAKQVSRVLNSEKIV